MSKFQTAFWYSAVVFSLVPSAPVLMVVRECSLEDPVLAQRACGKRDMELDYCLERGGLSSLFFFFLEKKAAVI